MPKRRRLWAGPYWNYSKPLISQLDKITVFMRVLRGYAWGDSLVVGVITWWAITWWVVTWWVVTWG